MRYPFLLGSIVASLIFLVILPFSSTDSAAQIRLAWDPNTDADLAGYMVYYGTASGTYDPPIDVGNATTYTVPGLTQGVTYYFAVTAYNSSDHESDYSSEVVGMVTSSPPESVSVPTVLSGPTSGVSGNSYTYTTGGSTSSLGDPVEYQFDWNGDETNLSPWGSATRSSRWTSPGTYNVRARARCTIHTNAISAWVGPLFVSMSQTTLSYTVTTSPSGRQITVDGTPYTAPQTFSWAVGSSHTLSVTSPQNAGSGTQYVYASWSDGGARSHSIVVPSSSATYTANFTTQYSLTTSASPSGGGTVNPSGTSWRDSGQSVSVSATASSGYAFSTWSGDLSSSANPSSMTMNGPKRVTANFSQNQHTLTVSISPSGAGTVSKSPEKSTYGYGDQVTLTATPSLAYVFNNWTGGATGTTNPVTLTINGNKTVTAFFSTPAVLAPQGGLVIPSGSLYAIRWNAPSRAVQFGLSYSTDNGATWSPIADGIKTMSYNWEVPTPPGNSRKCRVRIISYDDLRRKVWIGTSSAFVIEVVRLTSPNGGEILTSGTTMHIKWTTNGTKKPVATVHLYYTRNGAVTWALINSEPITGNPGSYSWTVPSVTKARNRCKVKIVLRDARGIAQGSDTSDAYFTIGP